MQVECSGQGLQENGLISGQKTNFKIDTRKAGKAPLDVEILDKKGVPIDSFITENNDGTYTCTFTPTDSKHTIQVTKLTFLCGEIGQLITFLIVFIFKKKNVQVNYGGVAVKNSPFRINVGEATFIDRIRIYGPGVEKNVKSNNPTHFTVDCKEAGAGNYYCSLFCLFVCFTINSNIIFY